MPETYGNRKYRTSELLGGSDAWDTLRVEHRHVGNGAQNGLTSECTELVYIMSGQATVRRKGDGQQQEGLARPGTSWLVPAGTHETLLELDGTTECLHIYFPGALLEHSALSDYDQDPASLQLGYIGGFLDPTIDQFGALLHGVLRREPQPVDRMFADGLRTALAAHLVGNYSVNRLRLPTRAPSMDATRLRRVLDFIEARLADDISLDDLAAEACLSPFHFSRVFREATGLSPHRYVVECRIRAACKSLACMHSSLVEIALDSGFQSQSSFTRAFRTATGCTPGQYRELHRSR